MYNFSKSVELREAEGFRAAVGVRLAGNSWEEIEDYLEVQPEIAR